LEPPSRAELVRYVQAQKENDNFKKVVEQELGECFFTMLDYYNNLDTSAKENFRDEQDVIYESVEQYYDMKESYQESHPVWADYFGLELEPTIADPTDTTSSMPIYSPPNPNQPKPAQSKEPAPLTLASSSPMPRGSQTYTQQREAPVQFNMDSRVSSSFSPQFLQTVGSKMSWEISQLFSANRKLSSAAVQFLQSLAARRPEYQQEVQSILSRNR
jgi:hypothetical protein